MNDFSALSFPSGFPHVRRDLFAAISADLTTSGNLRDWMEMCDRCGAIDALERLTYQGGLFLCVECSRPLT